MPSTFVPNPIGIARLVRGNAVARDLLRRAVRVESRAKQLCPVDTGRLRSSITHRLDQDSKELVAQVGTNVKYAPPVHNGHKTRSGGRVAARPFLRNALKAAS